MVNSDQTWRKWDENFYNIAFLKFSEKWKIPKFIYGTSLGFEDWKFRVFQNDLQNDLQFPGFFRGVMQETQLATAKKYI